MSAVEAMPALKLRDEFPATPDALLEEGTRIWAEIEDFKRSADVSWYPFRSLTALPVLVDLFAPCFGDIRSSIVNGSVLDLGCGDGDLAVLLALLGADVDAVDSKSTNFNGMEGVERLGSRCGVLGGIYDLDLDAKVEFPRAKYGLTLFLGTLYHLKNPYYLLEKLAYHTEWCVLSTRIAQVTPRTGAFVDSEPMAYLADGREINNDATNYWIFSSSGLLRLLQRTRWAIHSVRRVGCLTNSNPISQDKDERMFVLIQSRVYYPGLQVRTADGWYPNGGESWCWTAKKFSVQVVLPLETLLSGFHLRFYIPEAIEISSEKPLVLSCQIGSQGCGQQQYDIAGEQEFRGELAPFSLHEPNLMLNFTVHSAYQGDGRESGVCVHFTPLPNRDGATIPLTVF